MIFKKIFSLGPHRIPQKGNAVLIAVVLGGVGFLVATGIMKSNQNLQMTARARVEEATHLVDSHTAANLIKREVYAVFQTFQNDQNWNSCRVSGDDELSFVAVLQSPPSGCANAPVDLTHFKTTTNLSTISLGDIFNYTYKFDQKFNGKNIGFTLAGVRDRDAGPTLMGEMFIVGEAGKRMADKTRRLPIEISLSRTLYPPEDDNSCRLCRAVPGSLCCSDTVALKILDGSGQVVDVTHNLETLITTYTVDASVTANPRVMGLRGLESTKKEYFRGDLCIASLSCPNNLLEDAASDNVASYYLRSDGQILADSGGKLGYDPKIMSIAYQDYWYYLRSDGAVFRGYSISDLSSFKPIKGLRVRRALKLVMGEGP